MTNEETLTTKQIARLWSPLASTWLLMAAEGPLLAAVVARMANPEINLAAYGVAFSIAVIMESPIIMLMSASTKLVHNRQSYLTLRRFAMSLNVLVAAIMAALLASGFMGFVVHSLIGLSDTVANLTVNALWLMLPWPAAIGIRRFYQGLLISSGNTRLIAFGTLIRLSVIAISSFTLRWVTHLDGALIAASSLAAAVTIEALATRVMCGATIRTLLAETRFSKKESLTLKGIVSFYHPLALTSFIALAVHPAVSFFLGRGVLPLESLAVFPVVTGFIFLFRGTFGLSFQELGLSLMEKHPGSMSVIIRFAAGLAAAATFIVSLAAFTPLGCLWFENVAGLSVSLSALASVPLMILSALPALSVLLSFQRSTLMSHGDTRPITAATILEVGGTALVLLTATHFTSLTGAIVGALALMTGRIAANIYLMKPALLAGRSVVKRKIESEK